jgi:hypothetical protein
MKYLLSIILLISTNVYANSKTWSDLVIDNSYNITTQMILEKNTTKIELPLGANLKLQEKISLSMIKVELLKFDVSEYCSDSNFTTDISLIDIKQANGKVVTVGADIADDCILEVYVETSDYYSISFFK